MNFGFSLPLRQYLLDGRLAHAVRIEVHVSCPHRDAVPACIAVFGWPCIPARDGAGAITAMVSVVEV